MQRKSKAIFLDRDGTINKDTGYVCRIDQLELLPGVVEALQIFRDGGFVLIVISNQSGVGRGYFEEKEVAVFNKAIDALLAKSGVRIAKYYLCFHTPDDHCVCRKPSPYWINEAVKEFNIDREKSFLFGDKDSDVACGVNGHVASFLITAEKSLLFWAVKLQHSHFKI